MARVPTLALSALASMVLLGLGGLSAYSNGVWSVEWEYHVDVLAPNGVTWILWIPEAGVSMPWTTTGSAVVVGSVETPYGTRVNVTGTGIGRVRFSNATTFIGLEPRSAVPLNLSLSGGEGKSSPEFYRIWRRSSDPSANLTLSGGLGFVARSPPEIWTCGGIGFTGHPEEGWRALPVVFGECNRAYVGLARTLPLTLIGSGSVLAGVLVAAWRYRPR